MTVTEAAGKLDMCKKRCERKAADILDIIDAYRAKRSLLARCGASTDVVEAEIRYQEQRVACLKWCIEATSDEIRMRALALEAQLGEDGLKAMSLGAAGLPPLIIGMMTELSLLRLALEE